MKRFLLRVLHFAARTTDELAANAIACLLIAGLIACGWFAHSVHCSDLQRTAQIRHMNAQARYFELMTKQLENPRTFPGPEVFTPAAPDDVNASPQPTPAEPQSRLKGETP